MRIRAVAGGERVVRQLSTILATDHACSHKLFLDMI